MLVLVPGEKRYVSNWHSKNKLFQGGAKHCAFYIFNRQNILAYAGLFGLKENIHTEQKGFISAVTETFRKWWFFIKYFSLQLISVKFWIVAANCCFWWWDAAWARAGFLAASHPHAVNDVWSAKSSLALRAGRRETMLCCCWFSVLLAETPQWRIIKK